MKETIEFYKEKLEEYKDKVQTCGDAQKELEKAQAELKMKVNVVKKLEGRLEEVRLQCNEKREQLSKLELEFDQIKIRNEILEKEVKKHQQRAMELRKYELAEKKRVIEYEETPKDEVSPDNSTALPQEQTETQLKELEEENIRLKLDLADAQTKSKEELQMATKESEYLRNKIKDIQKKYDQQNIKFMEMEEEIKLVRDMNEKMGVEKRKLESDVGNQEATLLKLREDEKAKLREV